MYKKEKKREKVFVKFGKITDVLYIIYTDYKNILYFSTLNLFDLDFPSISCNLCVISK